MTTLSNRRPAAPSVAPDHQYARLYQAVILRAVDDLAQKEHQEEAREWLLSSESDFAFATAGISADGIRQQMHSIDEENENHWEARFRKGSEWSN